MRYWRAYLFVFDSPKWTVNLLCGIACSFIPVVGPIVLIGYLFEVIDFLLRSNPDVGVEPADESFKYPSDGITAHPPAVRRRGAGMQSLPYPDFDFNRFAEYLMRGLWPFLVQLVVTLPVAFVGFFVMFGSLFAVTAFMPNPPGGVVAALFVLWFGAYFTLIFLTGIVATPLYLRAGLGRSFREAFSLSFLRDFFGRMGKETIAAQLFLVTTSWVLMVLGMLACYVGLFPATALIAFAHHHLAYQLYDRYLERGGAPVIPSLTLP